MLNATEMLIIIIVIVITGPWNSAELLDLTNNLCTRTHVATSRDTADLGLLKISSFPGVKYT